MMPGSSTNPLSQPSPAIPHRFTYGRHFTRPTSYRLITPRPLPPPPGSLPPRPSPARTSACSCRQRRPSWFHRLRWCRAPRLAAGRMAPRTLPILAPPGRSQSRRVSSHQLLQRVVNRHWLRVIILGAHRPFIHFAPHDCAHHRHSPSSVRYRSSPSRHAAGSLQRATIRRGSMATQPASQTSSTTTFIQCQPPFGGLCVSRVRHRHAPANGMDSQYRLANLKRWSR